MTLLEDVHLPSGAILVNGSQKLTESLIQIIAKRGITKIQIVPEDTTPQSEPEEIKQEEEIGAEAGGRSTAARESGKGGRFTYAP